MEEEKEEYLKVPERIKPIFSDEFLGMPTVKKVRFVFTYTEKNSIDKLTVEDCLKISENFYRNELNFITEQAEKAYIDIQASCNTIAKNIESEYSDWRTKKVADAIILAELEELNKYIASQEAGELENLLAYQPMLKSAVDRLSMFAPECCAAEERLVLKILESPLLYWQLSARLNYIIDFISKNDLIDIENHIFIQLLKERGPHCYCSFKALLKAEIVVYSNAKFNFVVNHIGTITQFFKVTGYTEWSEIVLHVSHKGGSINLKSLNDGKETVEFRNKIQKYCS